MLTLMRIYMAITLSLAIVLAGLTAAQMQGMVDPAGQIVLCTGSGPVTVHVDEDGQPTRPPHHCPDCVMNLMTALVGSGNSYPVPPVIGKTCSAEPVNSVVILALLRATARGPPASV
jgi:hypothetical protein